MIIRKKRNQLIMGLLLCMLFVSCGQTSSEESMEMNKNISETEGSHQNVGYEQICVEEAKQLMEEMEDFVILDVRTEAEYANGHIPKAICVPNETIDDKIFEELPEKEQLIFVYCRSGNRSKQASEKLVELGYTNIKEFGGIIDWDGEIEK